MPIITRRRELTATLCGAAAWPLAASTRRAGRSPTVGFLGASTPSASGLWVAAIVQRLHEFGQIEGRATAIECRWSKGSPQSIAEIATEFARLTVDAGIADSCGAITKM